MRQTVLRQTCNLVRQQYRRRVRRLEEAVVIRQLAHLLGSDIRQFVTAITDIDAPKARHAIEDAVTVSVMDIATFGMGDDAAAAQILDFLPIGLGGQVMGDVETAEFGDVVIAGHFLILLNDVLAWGRKCGENPKAELRQSALLRLRFNQKKSKARSRSSPGNDYIESPWYSQLPS